MRPRGSEGSSGRLEIWNHSTSIGAPKSSTINPAAARTWECRPSVPTTSAARISNGSLEQIPLTPQIFPPSSRRPFTSAFVFKWKDEKRFAPGFGGSGARVRLGLSGSRTIRHHGSTKGRTQNENPKSNNARGHRSHILIVAEGTLRESAQVVPGKKLTLRGVSRLPSAQRGLRAPSRPAHQDR